MIKRFKIKTKITLIIFTLGLLLITAGIGLGYFWGFNLLRDSIGEARVEMAALISSAVDRILTDETSGIVIYMSHPSRMEATKEANQKYEGMDEDKIRHYFIEMDKKWEEAGYESPLVTEYLDNPRSQRLKVLAREHKGIMEIFMTDRFGGLVASSGKTSDFYQADETWWKEAFSEGSGSIYLGDITHDESVGALSMVAAVPITDHSGYVLGICKAVLDVSNIFSPLEQFHFGKTGHAALVNKYGYAIFHEGLKLLADRVVDEEDFEKVTHSQERWLIADAAHSLKNVRMLVGCAPVLHKRLLDAGINWWVFVGQDADEAFEPLNRLFLQLIAVVATLIIMLAAVGFLAGRIIAKPILKLREGTRHVASGDFDYRVNLKSGDEIEEFADFFNQMSAHLKSTTTSIEKLNKEIAERKKAEAIITETKRKLETQTWELKKANEGIKALYAELEKSNAELKKIDRLKTDFVSTVSHELRTPLSITKEGISLVLDKIPGKINEKQEKILNTAKESIDRLTRIINDLLDISKIEAGKVELNKTSVNLKELVECLATFFAEEAKKKGLRLTINFPEEPIELYADPDKMGQVFVNLIGNSLKFTEKGYIEVSARKLENTVECTVADTGKGIPKNDLPKLFSKFEQFGRLAGPGEKGTGLGLSIVKGIIELHNGRIWSESKPGKGTKFTFMLPVYTSDRLFKEYVENGIKQAKKGDYKLSLLIIAIEKFEKLKKELPREKIKEMLKYLEGSLRGTLRKEGDIVAKDTGEIMVLLANCNKENALRIEGRLQQSLEECRSKHHIGKKIELHFGCATYPDDAKTERDLIIKARNA